MLAVQVQYWDLQERVRHNKVSERQNDRNLNIQEFDSQTRRMAAEETARHNLITESQNWTSIYETQRHNIATEALQAESNYINMFRAQTDRSSLAIQAYNAETNRMNAQTNAAMIPIQWYNATTQRTSVENANWYNQQQVDLQQDRNNIYRYQAVTGSAASYSQAYSTAENADINFYNAQTAEDRNRIQEEYNEKILEMQKAQLITNTVQKGNDQFISVLKWVTDTITKGWRNMYEQP